MIAPLRRPDPPRPSYRRRTSATLRKARQLVAERLLPQRGAAGAASASRTRKLWLAVLWMTAIITACALAIWR